jgi:tryptophan synthase alpha chain
MNKNMNTQIDMMTHLVAGYPTFNASLDLARTLASAGADILEIQIPFSEPVADGPTIVEACHIALKNGFTVGDIFDFCKQTSRFGVPIVVMSYANPIMSIGIDAFCARIAQSGAHGLIVPDLPFDSEEGVELCEATKRYGLSLIQVISPSMNLARLKGALAASSGMIYCTTRRGTTGDKVTFSEDLRKIVKEARKHSGLRIALGFGIASKGDVRSVAKIADIAVVGSAIIRAYNDAAPDRKSETVSRYMAALVH